MARNVKCSYFLAGCFVWLMLFGCRKGCFRVLPAFIIVGGLFAVIAYFAYGKDLNTAIAMANRFASVFLAAALGMTTIGIYALGIEIAKRIYLWQGSGIFNLYGLISGLLWLALMWVFLKKKASR